MNITSEQRELLALIMDKKEVLEELLKDVSTHKKQVKDLKIRESITVTDIIWSKFAEDSEGNAFMLADKNIENSKFGDNNDWRESSIRKKLNGELYQKVIEELGSDALVSIQTNLFSHDGLNDYGFCEDKFSLLTYDLYRNNRENIKSNDGYWWLSTPDSTPSGYDDSCVRYVRSDGCVRYDYCGCAGGVRPFFILKSDIFVSCNSVADSR